MKWRCVVILPIEGGNFPVEAFWLVRLLRAVEDVIFIAVAFLKKALNLDIVSTVILMDRL